MPLHLLGKKSWNVYNQENISRVHRDEVEAQARTEAEEQRMQEEDAKRRIALLKGEYVSPLPPQTSVDDGGADDSQRWRTKKADDTYAQRDVKRKRRRGEDDTDRDIRYAKQDYLSHDEKRGGARELLSSKDKDAPLADHAGHIQLIPAPEEGALRKAEKNAEAEAEKARKRRRDEDQYTMRFSNAAGFQQGLERPWYAAHAVPDPQIAATTSSRSSADTLLAALPAKDVWGNEDPRRTERERSRITSSDPFAAMQQAQRQLKQSETDRQRWERKQEAEREELRVEERRRRHSRRRRREKRDRADSTGSLEGFSLDAASSREVRPAAGDQRHRRRHRHDEQDHRRRRCSRSRSREHGVARDHRSKHRHGDSKR